MIFSLTKTSDTVTPALKNMIRAIGGNGRRRILISMGQKFVDMTQSNFGQSGGKYKDSTWKPLSKSYSKRVGSSVPTLKRSGELFKSIRMNSPRQNFVEIYTKNSYAAAHTFGNRSRNLPPRNFWPIQFSTPSYSRLLFNAEKEMIVEIGKRLSIQSGGAFPRLSLSIVRSPFQYGNVFTSPQSSET